MKKKYHTPVLFIQKLTDMTNISAIFKKTNCFRLLLALLLAIPTENIQADGSRNLYPSGAKGRRAYLTSYYLNYGESLPFQSYGTHYVYAKKGETIALASSAWTGDATIKLFNVQGVKQTLDRSNNAGRISVRNNELAGPKLTPTDNTSNRYLPIYYSVPEDGIYKVEFWSKTTTAMTSDNNLVATNADAQWKSWNGTSDGRSTHIGAWDVSVINKNRDGFISGRVYATMLNMRIEPSSDVSQGFYGKMYVLTKDGYTYRVDNNGNNGILFSFFVNNNGFVKGQQPGGSVDYTPIYKSLTSISGAVSNKQIWDPTGPDNEQNITHKMFYTLPSQDLPKDVQVPGSVPGGKTWLRNTVVVPRVMNVKIQGVDDTEGQVSTKGGNIKFTTESQGAYTIKIESSGTPVFATRYLYGTAVAGSNSVYWDGKDGNGASIPAGTAPASITVQLQGAEVHFPYFDMENNIDGIKLELLNHELLPGQEVVKSDIVYWNDTGIPINNIGGNASNPINNSHLPSSLGGANSAGISSAGLNGQTANGHKWGGSSTTGTFGDARSMDTWTFILGEKETIDTEVTVKTADLEVASVTTDKDNIRIGDNVEYTVTVKNNGPSDVKNAPFTFRLPSGFEPDGDPIFSGGANCTESIGIEYDPATHTYWSKLDLSNGCEISYTFKAKVTDASDPDNTTAVAGILRPNDVTDPNATNRSDPSKPMYELTSGHTWDDLWKYPASWPNADDVDNYYVRPFSAEFECANRPADVTEPCNNIGKKSVGLLRESDMAMEKSVNNSKPDVGDEITFTLTVTNNGPHDATGIIITDTVPAGFTIGTINNNGTATGNIITWTTPKLAKDEVISVNFTATVNKTGPYVNIATVIGDGKDPNPDNNTDTETASPKNNYWIGGKIGAPNDWDEENNWTAGFVPAPGEDIEFATEDNNGTFDPDIPNSGPAKDNLYLGADRVIGDLINDSGKDLWITTGDQLTINGVVRDNNSDGGTIIVKADPEDKKPTGTLFFADPEKNKDVEATVEFYNRAYDCADCGFYTRSWQYFGIPVKNASFPYSDVGGDETVNQWVVPFNGNKWQQAPYTPDTELKAFKGYQMTNNIDTKPTAVYDFKGTLNTGDAAVPLTRTTNVNYPGVNLVGNSYTAAISISEAALTFPTGVEQTVYLFNTGTRDQWKKLNGTAINHDGYKSGQYLAVPVNLGGQGNFPDRIPSMHAFMLRATSGTGGNLTIKYDQLVKNTTVNRGDGTQIVTRSATSESTATTSTSTIPSLVMDVIGEQSADRVWIFAKEGTTYGFDNGWDGRKMPESGIAQLYVADEAGKDRFQVATVPGLDNIVLGFEADADGKYTVEFALSDHWTTEEIYLHDLATGTKTQVTDGSSYTFEARKGTSPARFRLSYSGNGIPRDNESAKIVVNATTDGKIAVSNNSSRDCTAFISNAGGKLVQRLEVEAGSEKVVENITGGTYVVRLQNAVVNDTRRVDIQ